MSTHTTTESRVTRLRRHVARAASTAALSLVLLPTVAVTAWAQADPNAPGGDIPDFPVVTPEGLAGPLNALGGNAKWMALISIAITFFAGLVVMTLGKVFDNQRAHRFGIGLILSALGAAIGAAVGIPFINSFRG